MTTPQPPPHPVPALTSSELSGCRRRLEQAITGTPPDAPAQDGLHRRLEEVLAEQHSRAALRGRRPHGHLTAVPAPPPPEVTAMTASPDRVSLRRP